LDYIAKQKPKVFILENVSGLVNLEGGKYLKDILAELRGLGLYNIQHKILDTKEHGVPHSRRRWYAVGILKSVDDGSFSFPEPLPLEKRPKIELFLERRKADTAKTGLPPASQGTALKNVKTALRTLKREGSDPTKDPFIVDCDSSPNRMKWVDGVSPCITCSRGAGHWVTNRGRRLTKEEMMRLQGMDPTQFTVAVTEHQLGRQLGNTMSVNVLERLLVRVLPAAKLAQHGALADRWKSGQAIRKLIRTRGCGFKAVGLKRKAPDSSASDKKKTRRA
jgi:DNA (cytosine-5)-methyltransferase 1